MTSDSPRLLIVDSDPGVLASIGELAGQLGFDTFPREGGEDALAGLRDVRPDAAMVDLQTPGLSGLAVVATVREADHDCQVILTNTVADVDTAVQAMKAGALDYLTKPFDLDRLREILITVRESIRRRERLIAFDTELARKFEFYGMIGRSPAMQELFDSIRRLAPHVRTVLVTGETGTGKELVAAALHKLGPRRTRRMVTLNCSAVVENLFESELFGHVRGAFTGATESKVGTFEHADGGTLFLDETGELPLTLQAKLLRAVEYGEVQRVGSIDARKMDVHVIAATNRNLRAEAATGRFRSDLFYRLSIIELHLPPLRNRREDIPYLVATFTREFSQQFNKPITGVTTAAERVLQDAPWPGNIRELRNVLERACILSDNRILSERDVTKAMPAQDPDATAPPAAVPAYRSADEHTTDAALREEIVRALSEVGGNKTEAARRLRISRRSLYRWIDRFQLQ